MHYILTFLCFAYFIVQITSKGLDRNCPQLVPNERCEFEQKFDTCQTNTDCKYGKVCCPRKCGLRCIKLDQKHHNPSCPPYRTDVICKRFDRQCSNDKDCKGGLICCRVECGTVCKTGKNIYLPPDICSLPKVTGPCEAYIPRYYYNKKVMKCLRFIYGGCEGNKNNFETLKQCKQRCELEDPCPLPKCPLVQVPIGVCSRDTFFDFDGIKCKGCPEIVPCNKECLLPKDIGPCYADIKRYYYDTDTKSCKEFRYGGCEGNKNNFITLDTCKSSCRTEPCPQVKCSNICPYGFQTTPQGCPTCICKTKCPRGEPLPRLNCGLIPNPDQCPKGYFCNVDEIDRFAVCCRDPCFPPPRCPRPPRGPPETCPPQCVYEYAIVNGKRCRVECKLGPPGPKGEPGEPCPPSLCGDGIAEPLPPPTTTTTTKTTPPPSKGPCPPRPPCPRLGRMGKPGAPGPCPPKCIYEYAIVNGKRCRVACTRGPDGPDRQPGEFCPPTLCSDGREERISPLPTTPRPRPPKKPKLRPPPSKDRCDPPPRCPKPDRGPPGQCPPKCIYDYATVNGKRCKVGCHLGGKGPLVESGERCPPTMCEEREPIGPRDKRT